MRNLTIFLLTLLMAGCATARPAPTECGANHKPVAIIEVRRA